MTITNGANNTTAARTVRYPMTVMNRSIACPPRYASEQGVCHVGVRGNRGMRVRLAARTPHLLPVRQSACARTTAACYRRGRPEYLRTRRVTPHTEQSPSVASIPGQPRTIMLTGPTAARDSPVAAAIHGMHRAVPECDTRYVLTRSARVWPRGYRGTPAPQRMKSTVRFFSSHRVHRPHARTT